MAKGTKKKTWNAFKSGMNRRGKKSGHPFIARPGMLSIRLKKLIPPQPHPTLCEEKNTCATDEIKINHLQTTPTLCTNENNNNNNKIISLTRM